MKKLVFGLIATVMLSATSFAQETTPKENPPLIEFEFGRKSKNCGGIGVCKFKINLTVENAVTLITALARNGKIQAVMSPTFYKNNAKAFPNGYLVLEEDYKIDLETTRRLGVADNYTIKTGKYLVVFDKSTNTYNCTF